MPETLSAPMAASQAPATAQITAPATAQITAPARCQVVVIWIDWYPYHVARFRGLLENEHIGRSVVGLELVGGVGVHAGLKFRETLPQEMPIRTLMPEGNWKDASKPRLALALWRRLNELGPDVVLVPGYYTLPAVAAALWAKLHDRKSVLMTESTRADHQRVWWKESLKGLLIRTLFDWAVTGGQAHRGYLADLGFPAERVARFYDVVDNDFYRRECAALRLGSPVQYGLPATPYFLYVGRLASEKNVDGLLTAYLTYRQNGGSWPLVLAGDGQDARALKEVAATSPYSAEIHFLGHKSSSELPMLYAFAGCFVLPSTREPWGLVVNEAMASGLPVIVSNRCGCVPDLMLQGRTGVVFDPTVPGDLADSLGAIASATSEQLRSMGRTSYAQVSPYSPAAFAREIASIADS